MIKNLGERYSPLYFLGALGFGGLAVFFFMAFMHITPHPGRMMPTFETIQEAFSTGTSFMRTVIIVGYLGMAAMLAVHFILLIWNLRELRIFQQTEAYVKLRNSNAEVTMMAIPLTLGMTINGLFVAGMAFVPGLERAMQSLMPFALLAYAAVGVLALYYMTRYLNRIITTRSFDFKANGGLNQMIAAFSLAMVAVGLAAPAALAEHKWISLIALAGSLFFLVLSALVTLIFLPAGAMSIMQYGLSLGNSATMWLPVPMLTLWSITVLRLRHALLNLSTYSPMDLPPAKPTSILLMAFLGLMIVAQLAFLGLGHYVMVSNGFYKDYVKGNEIASPAAFTLVCPGVGLSVVSMFFVNIGLVQNGLVEKFSGPYFLLIGLIAIVAGVTMALAITLFRNQISAKHSAIGRERATRETKAEIKTEGASVNV